MVRGEDKANAGGEVFSGIPIWRSFTVQAVFVKVDFANTLKCLLGHEFRQFLFQFLAVITIDQNLDGLT